MDSGIQPSPRKARKSMKKQGNIIAAPNLNQSVSNTTSSSTNPLRKSARKSTGTRILASNVNQTAQHVQSPRTRNSVASSLNSIVPISLANDSGDSDSDGLSSKNRKTISNSLSSTLHFSQPGGSKDPDSSDSDVSSSQTQKILMPRTSGPASKTSKKGSADVSSTLSSTSEDEEVEEMLRKQAEKRNAMSKVAKPSQQAKSSLAKAGKSLTNPNKLVSQCVFYILVANRSKKAIRKREIIQHVFEGRNTQMFPEILKKAASTLQKTFGFELMELKSNKNEYLLVNNLCHQYEVQEFAEYSPMDRQKQGFIFYILTLIFMNDNSILEDELWKALDPLEVEIKSRKPHPIFGDVQKFVTNTLVKQMYLERRQISKDPPQFELFWGERAHKEVLKEDLLDFVCKVMPETKPEEWILQYKDAKGRATEGDAEME